MSLAPFQPAGGTLIVSSTLASATTVQFSTCGQQAVRIANRSTLDAYVLLGSSSSFVVAAPTTTSSTAAGMLIIQRAANEKFTCPPQCWISAITTAGQADLAVTPGFGQ